MDQSSTVAGGNAGYGAHQVVVDGIDVTPPSLLNTRVYVPQKKRVKHRTKMGASKQIRESSSNISIGASSAHSKSTIGGESTEGSRVPLPYTGDGGEEEEQDAKSKVSALELRKRALARMRQLEQQGLAVQETSMRRASSSSSSTAATKPPHVTIKLEETKTIMLFELPSVCVALDSQHHAEVTARNEAYLTMCRGKQGSDFYTSHHTQTLNNALKNKEVMAKPPATRDAECEATNWDIYDWYVVVLFCARGNSYLVVNNTTMKAPSKTKKKPRHWMPRKRKRLKKAKTQPRWPNMWMKSLRPTCPRPGVCSTLTGTSSTR